MKPEASRAVFGSFDGATSLIGVLAGLAVTHAPMLAVVAGLALASAVGMGFGDYLAGAPPRLSLIMAGATLAGAFLPALPVILLDDPAGYAIGGGLFLALGVLISEARISADQPSRVKAYGSTAAVLAVTSALSIGAALLAGTAS